MRVDGRSSRVTPSISSRSKSIVTQPVPDHRQEGRLRRRARRRPARADRTAARGVDRSAPRPRRRPSVAHPAPPARPGHVTAWPRAPCDERPAACHRPVRCWRPRRPTAQSRRRIASVRYTGQRLRCGTPDTRHRQGRASRQAAAGRHDERRSLQCRLAHGRRLRALQAHVAELLNRERDVLDGQRELLLQHPRIGPRSRGGRRSAPA